MKKKSKLEKPFFDPVDTKTNFSEAEKRILDRWYKSGVVEKYLKKNNSSKKIFSFLDGPITANNPMGVHHGWGRTYKDLWQRFKNMQGYKQRFQNGFDCQGLWVEVEVEKELGFKNKKEIESYGVEKFVNKCKERVYKYAGIQTEQSKRLGYFMDWDNSYYTLTDDNNYMIWNFLKVCHENGWLYKGADSVPWCPRCETAISQHEILTEDYKDVVHDSIYFTLPIIGEDNEYLLVWTTTPWTIPANIAVAVDKNLDYSLIKSGKNKYWIAKDAVKRVIGKKTRPVKTVKGADLVGLKYRTVFDEIPEVKRVSDESKDKFHIVIATDDQILPINVEEGTGMVHTAVSAGREDFKLGKKLGLPMIPVINDKAEYLEEMGFLSGKNAKKHPELILDFMEEKDKEPGEYWVYKIEKCKHRYPSCWRCKTELVWKVTDEWYISMDESLELQGSETQNKKSEKSGHNKTLRQRMIGVAKTIKWIPSFGLKRELDWLENMEDWLISKKNRYWGLALPIWECSFCGNFEVIGSKEELKKRAVEGWEQFQGKSPHKPQIDQIKIKCSKCGQEVSRVEPVGNPWLDAGIVAYSTISESNHAANPFVKGGKPLYKENKKKWRKWFPADFITEGFPGQFKNWFYALIAMSTVLENERPTKVILGHEDVWAEDGRPMHKSWGNAIEFNEGAEKIGVDVMRWLYTRQNPTEKLLFGYKVGDEIRRKFHLKLWNVYNFFTTYANFDGYKPSYLSKIKKSQAKNVLDEWILARLKQTSDGVTKHLEDYDAFSCSLLIEEFVDDLSNWYIRRSRTRVGVMPESDGDRNNFYETCFFVLVTLTKILAPFTPFIAEAIYKNLTKQQSVHLESWPTLTYEFDKGLTNKMAKVREIVEKIHSERKDKEIPVRRPLASFSTNYKNLGEELEKLLLEEVNIKKANWSQFPGKDLRVKLDTKITDELRDEAKTRELIRKIQNERKKLGFGLRQKARVYSEWIPNEEKLIEQIKKVTVAETLDKGKFEVRKA